MSWVNWALWTVDLVLLFWTWVLKSDEQWYREHPGAEERFTEIDLELDREEEKEYMREDGWIFPEDWDGSSQ